MNRIFFFQAEDGIRDAQESRGLGDVYKRQTYYIQNEKEILCKKVHIVTTFKPHDPEPYSRLVPVSYTHLTLPTIYSV